MRRTTATSILCLVTLLACSNKSSRDGTIGSTGGAIVGGNEDTGDPAVVLVSAQDDASGTGWWCTGSVIAKRVVLTAAHCVEDATATTKFQVLFANDESTAPASAYVDVVSFDHDPQYMVTNNIAAGHDAAVLILGQDATVAPLAINTTPLTSSMIGGAVYVVGYGNDDGAAGTGAGTKRDLHTTVANLEQGVVDIGGPGQTTCQGDSGGPSFMTINGQSVIVGITSFGEEGCVDYGSSTRVDLSASWIQPFIDANGGAGDAGAGAGGSDAGPGNAGGDVGTGTGDDAAADAGAGNGGDDAGSNEDAGPGDDSGTGATPPNSSCVYPCSAYGYEPGQCSQGWYCIPDGDLAGCLGQTDC